MRRTRLIRKGLGISGASREIVLGMAEPICGVALGKNVATNMWSCTRKRSRCQKIVNALATLFLFLRRDGQLHGLISLKSESSMLCIMWTNVHCVANYKKTFRGKLVESRNEMSITQLNSHKFPFV